MLVAGGGVDVGVVIGAVDSGCGASIVFVYSKDVGEASVLSEVRRLLGAIPTVQAKQANKNIVRERRKRDIIIC